MTFRKKSFHPLPHHLPGPAAAPPVSVHPPPARSNDYSIPPPTIVAHHSQSPPGSFPTSEPSPQSLMSDVPATALLPSIPPSVSQSAQLLPPLIPTPPTVTDVTTMPDSTVEDSCLLYSPATSSVQSSPPIVPPPATRPPVRTTAPRPRQATRPPSWAEITARRIPPLFPVSVWQPGYVPAASSSHPPLRAPVRQSGTAPNNRTSSHSFAPHHRPPPRVQRQPRANPSRSSQGRSRPTRPPPQPIQELLIDLN